MTPKSDSKLNFKTSADWTLPSLEEIQNARKVLSKLLAPSPLLHNRWISEHLGCEIYLKLESMQPIGSFKIRGATYRISQLSAREKKRGVIAASAGNHAQGVAWGASQLGTSALIVMPLTAPLVKVQNTRQLGAEVVLAGNNYDEAYAHAQSLIKKTGRIYIHAFQDPAVIAGQGTVALEILEQLPDPDFLIGSLGGGGMMSGISSVFSALRSKTELIGCQASGADSMVRSIRQTQSHFRRGTPRPRALSSERVDTFADGIAVAKASEKMLDFLSPHLHQVVTCSDEDIAYAVLLLLEKAKILIEGSGAIALSAAYQLKKKLKGKKGVLVLSGGNIDINFLTRIIDRGLVSAGRKMRICVVLPDRPGALALVSEAIAATGANILQALHDRDEPSVRLDQTEVTFTLETKGGDHQSQILQQLEGAGFQATLLTGGAV